MSRGRIDIDSPASPAEGIILAPAMTIADGLRLEFEGETRATRRYLERLPGDKLTWRPHAKSFTADALLAAFDADVVRGTRALAAVGDEAVTRPWRMMFKGQVRFERPKAMVFRDFTLSHLIHHRGQLSVYLRLLDVPVPGAYGPTADE
jgi:uncharacterized damage-inducible protein DinB